MPALPLRQLDDVARHVAATVLRPSPPGTVGVELEWLVADRAAPADRVPLARLRQLVDPVPRPGSSALTYEPGGQLELSSAPAPTLAACCGALSADVHAVRDRLASAGLVLAGLGSDPLRAEERLLEEPRYTAMAGYFAGLGADGASGPAMMTSTAAIQVNVEAGRRAGEACSGGAPRSELQTTAGRWRRAHLVGPALVAAFAHSPLRAGRPTGWRSSRQQTWAMLDPIRTTPMEGADASREWTRRALAARVMFIRDPDSGACALTPLPVTFADWVEGVAGLRRPTTDDLACHLTTLFPPVRPRGWLELRMLDALPDPWWQVAAAVTVAVLDDDEAALTAEGACGPVAGRWTDAARLAVSDPSLARAAEACLTAAMDALPRLDAAGLVPLVHAYLTRWTGIGRCPADDVLDAYTAGASPSELLLAAGHVDHPPCGSPRDTRRDPVHPDPVCKETVA